RGLGLSPLAMKPLLLQIDPLDIAADARVTARAADGLNAEVFGLGGQEWKPAMAERPQVTVELMSLNLDGSVQPARLTVAIDTNALGNAKRWQALKWIGAPLSLWSAGDLSWANRRLEFNGQVNSTRLDIND